MICEPGHRRDGRGGSVAGLMRSTTLLRMNGHRERDGEDDHNDHDDGEAQEAPENDVYNSVT